MLLTRQELHDLTGYERPSAQIRWLKRYGVRFFEGRDGYPRVLRSDLENKEKQRATETDMRAVGWVEKNINRWMRDLSVLLDQRRPYVFGDGPDEPGIYFLIRDDAIQYVGIASAICRRLIQHAHRTSKRRFFTHYSCLLDIPDIWLPAVESFYIHKLTPPWNEKFPPIHAEVKRHFGASICS